MSWPLVAIKDVAKVVTGKTPSTSDEENFGGDIPFVTPAELDLDHYVISGQRTLSSKGVSSVKLVPKNAVLVCCIGSLGKMAIAGRPLATNQQINSVVFGEEVDAKYGFYALKRLKPQMEAMAPSTTVAIINKGNFEGMKIPLPPLSEQKRIAAMLDKADAIRRKRQQAIQLADDFLRAVFLDMFGDPVTNPKGWPVAELGNLIIKGPTNGLYKHSSEYGSGTPILRIDGFYNGRLVRRDEMKRVRLSSQEVDKFKLDERSVVINRVNSREYLGKCAFISGLTESSVFESNMMNFSVDESVLNPVFFVGLMVSPYIKNQILSLAKDAVNQSSINQQDVKSLRVLLPPLALQKKYESVVNAYDLLGKKFSTWQVSADDAFRAITGKAFSAQL